MIYQQPSVDADAAIMASLAVTTAAHVFGLLFYFSAAVATVAASSEAMDVAVIGFGL